MPANKKHLSPAWQRTLKLTAAVFGGYWVTISFHQFIMLFLSKKHVFATMSVSLYLMWCGLMVVAFMFKNGWKAWALYLSLSLVFYAPFFYNMYLK